MTADLVIPIVFGPEWLGSIVPFRILCLFSIFYALSLIANQILLSAGLASSVFHLSVMNALVFVVAVATAAPYGIEATAIAGGTANTLCLPAYFYVLRKRLRLDLIRLGNDLLPIWTSAISMVILVLAARYVALNTLDPLLTLGLSILLGVLVFSGAIWLFRRDYVDELATILLGDRSHNHSS